MDVRIGDTLVMKKNHPCGAEKNIKQIIREGAAVDR